MSDPKAQVILDGLIKELDGRNRDNDSRPDDVSYWAGVLRRTADMLMLEVNHVSNSDAESAE